MADCTRGPSPTNDTISISVPSTSASSTIVYCMGGTECMGVMGGGAECMGVGQNAWE